ncbi:hypothetical protein [Streptomyces sp. NPDC059994]|uniref:hypothetical protein n=1 Tax=Streptomyces sp. NPDC059994 TaxID=3347029 RepID=UPI00367CF86B
MDLNELMTRDGMGGFSSGQRDTFVNDATEIRQMSRIVRARLAQTAIDGDKPWSARRRAAKVAGRFDRVAKLLEKAAAECEAIDATYGREVLDLPQRRATALAKKEQRREHKILTAQRAHALTQRTIAEATQGLVADPRAAGQQTGMPQAQPVYVSPQAPPLPQPSNDPLPQIHELFKGIG